MSDEPALLAAIIAAPADDTARLVYADWLQEHGREQRAELIRLQIVDPVPSKREEWFFHNGPVRDFCETPLSEWGHDPRQPHTDLGGRRVVWTRGFVGQLVLPAFDWRDHGDAIRARNPVTLVRLTNSRPHWHGRSYSFYHEGRYKPSTIVPPGAGLSARVFDALYQLAPTHTTDIVNSRRIGFPSAAVAAQALRDAYSAEWPGITFTFELPT